MKSLYTWSCLAVLILAILTQNFFLTKVNAACLSSSAYSGDQTIGASCTITTGTSEFADKCSASEASSNTAVVTITAGGTPVIVTMQSAANLYVGSITLGPNASIQIGGSTNIGKKLYVVDADADGWPSNINTVTAADASPSASYRRRCLMKTTTSDCNDANAALTNNCYSYSQSTYYAYSQSTYYSYGYSQGTYYSYGYSQGTYYSYGYGQAGYYSYGYGQSAYYSYGYGQSAYYCFLPETQILLANGATKAIKDIKEGDVVVSYNTNTKQVSQEKVVNLIVHPQTSGTYLTINGILNVTANHPMWINGEWKSAGTAKIGDTLVSSNGQTTLVTSLSQSPEGVHDLYNLHLEGNNHNYFAEGLLVHNK